MENSEQCSHAHTEHVAEVAPPGGSVAIAEVLRSVDHAVGSRDLRGCQDLGHDEITREVEEEERVVIHGSQRLTPSATLPLLAERLHTGV